LPVDIFALWYDNLISASGPSEGVDHQLQKPLPLKVTVKAPHTHPITAIYNSGNLDPPPGQLEELLTQAGRPRRPTLIPPAKALLPAPFCMVVHILLLHLCLLTLFSPPETHFPPTKPVQSSTNTIAQYYG